MSERESEKQKWYKRISFNFRVATDKTFLYSDLLLLLIVVAVFIFMACAANVMAEFDKGIAQWGVGLYEPDYDGYNFHNKFLGFMND